MAFFVVRGLSIESIGYGRETLSAFPAFYTVVHYKKFQERFRFIFLSRFSIIYLLKQTNHEKTYHLQIIQPDLRTTRKRKNTICPIAGRQHILLQLLRRMAGQWDRVQYIKYATPTFPPDGCKEFQKGGGLTQRNSFYTSNWCWVKTS